MKYISLSGLKRALEQTVNYVKAQIKSNVTDKLGAASGIATLGTDGKLTSGQLPSIDKTYVGLSNVTNTAQIPLSQKGAVNGVATLGADGKVPSSQLPSYVDDVLEYTNKSSFPTTGETGKIYVDTSTSKTYRWGGTTYVEISASLALGETSSTAYAGDKGKALATQVSTLEAKIPTIIRAEVVTDSIELSIGNRNGPISNTYLDPATDSKSGLMLPTDKSKLDGIAAGAQVNKIEKITIDGQGASITGKTVDIPMLNGVVPKDIRFRESDGKFYTYNDMQNYMFPLSIGLASETAHGFMSSADKSKLDGIVAATDDEIDTIFAESIA